MYDPVMRVLTVLEILQTRERVTGAELARRMEVSRRTVQRYVARLQDLGIPVESRPGVGGAYRLRPGFRLPPLMFTDDEAFAVALGLRALSHLGLDALAPATEAVAAKLERVVPHEVRDRVVDVGASVVLEPGRWTVATDPTTLVPLAGAVRARRRVAFRYVSHQGSTTERQVEPYGLVHLDGRWYLVGRCLLRQALRTFRLDRVRDVEQLGARFERPASFDASGYLMTSLPFVMERYAIEVRLELPLETARRRLEPWRVALEADGDGTMLRCTREELEPFAAMLLGLGCALSVQRPEALRASFARLAERAVAASR